MPAETLLFELEDDDPERISNHTNKRLEIRFGVTRSKSCPAGTLRLEETNSGRRQQTAETVPGVKRPEILAQPPLHFLMNYTLLILKTNIIVFHWKTQ